MTKYYKFWCEWDIGCNDSIFISEEMLLKHAKQALKDCGIEDDINELVEEGLFGVDVEYIVEEWCTISIINIVVMVDIC